MPLVGNPIPDPKSRYYPSTSVADWTRPTDWLSLGTCNTNEFRGLFGVTNDDANYVALQANTTAANYTVNWGDGVTDTVTTGVKASHQYTYSALTNTECWTRGTESAVTFQDSGDTVTLTAHGLANGNPVRFSSITTTTGISTGTTYYVVNRTADTFQVASSIGGGALALTTNGSGTLLLPAYRQSVITVAPSSDGVLTGLSLQQTHPNMALAATTASLMWLDMELNAPQATTFALAASSTSASTRVFAPRALERVVISGHGLRDMGYQFYNCEVLRSVSISDTSFVTNMANMFNSCYLLTTVPLFDTSRVTSLSQSFINCSSLSSVPLFNTANVTSMSSMFSGCYSLASVPLFNTANVASMSNMIANCYSLTSVPLFNTASVTNMSAMFSSCYSLASVPLFNTANVTNMSSMFFNCSSLTFVPLFNTPNVTSMSSMFSGCNSLASVPLFNTANVANMSSMFSSCFSLPSVSQMNASGVTSAANFSTIFSNCPSLSSGVMRGAKYTISYASCKLSKTAIENIFDALGIGDAQTITTTSNFGSVPITKASCGTTAGSNVITIADTSSLAIGMEMTGTGVSSALSFSTDTTADTITITGHGIANGTPVSLATLVTSTGLSVNTIYYVVNATTDTFQLAVTAGGSAIDITGSNGTGTLRRPMTITSITPNTSVTMSSNCSATGSVSLVATSIQRWKATLKGWTVAP